MSLNTEKSSPTSAQELDSLLKKFTKTAFSLEEEDTCSHRPIYGTTLYVAQCDMELRFGLFKAYVFQDIIHKGYIVALCYGDIQNADTLHSRIHSSCVTSETLRGCDCDCVQQLEGALQRIAEEGNGVLFYLMQEGRGVGYVSKARDRMLVQATHDSISTFEAYRILGLNKDYRGYRNVRDIGKMLSITAPLILLTNNPDKVAAMKRHEFKIERTENLEFEPSPYNLSYLQSKMESGHILKKTNTENIKRIEPPEQVIPITPQTLPEAQRFVYAANYYLPINPVDGEIIVDQTELKESFKENSIESYLAEAEPLIFEHRNLRNQRHLVKINEPKLKSLLKTDPQNPLCNLLSKPYWFKAHVYYDTVTGEDFVVLTYGKPTAEDTPVVRIHSESIFNRFPVTDMDNRDKFKSALQEIVSYGVGIILLLYNDGRGAGLGAYTYDKMLLEQNKSQSTDESYRQLGVSYDSRDYDSAMMLLKHHLPHSNNVQMVMNSPSSMVKKLEWVEALNKHAIEVQKWIFLETENS